MKIFVGNLAFTATDQDIRQLFEPYGVMDMISVITNRNTGHSKGFGFVERPDSQAAKAGLVGSQGQALAGRALTVAAAQPRETRRELRQARRCA